MEDILTKSLEHAPDLVFALTLVIIFVKFLTSLLSSHSKRTDEFIATVTEINGKHNEASAESRQVVNRNTDAMIENTVVLREVIHTLRDDRNRT